MPRLTDAAYLSQRNLLVGEVDQQRGRLIHLDIGDQVVLHDFFQPSRTMTDQEALAYRRRMTEAWPSLPHQAGRAYSRLLQQPLTRPQPAVVNRGGRAGKRKRLEVRAAGQVRADIDFDKLARVLVAIARERDEQKRQKTAR